MRRKCTYLVLLLGALLLSIPARAADHARSAMFRTSDGVTLHYLDAGNEQAPAIVLIPGWTMPADIFEPQLNGLSAQFRVISIDLRSHGYSEKASDGNYPEAHARDVNELIQHLKLRGVVLLGWSNGVPDVLCFVDEFGTANLRGIVLVDGFIDPSAAPIQSFIAGMLKIFQTDRAKYTDDFVRGMYNSKPSEAYIQHIKQASLRVPTNTAVVELYNVISHGPFTPILAKIDKPALFICTPRIESQGKILQDAIAKSRIEVFKEAGHAMFVDEPDRFNKVVAEFVAGLPPAN